MANSVTLTEAARRLGVSRTKVWSMVKRGELQARQDPLDKRKRLVTERAIEEILENRGMSPRPWPRTIGLVSDGMVQSEDIEDYLREHWRPE